MDKDVSCQFGEKTYQYTVWDFVKEFLNPRNGAQPPLQIREEIIPPEKSLNKVTLVAHSAGGWICRILVCYFLILLLCSVFARKNLFTEFHS